LQQQMLDAVRNMYPGMATRGGFIGNARQG